MKNNIISGIISGISVYAFTEFIKNTGKRRKDCFVKTKHMIKNVLLCLKLKYLSTKIAIHSLYLNSKAYPTIIYIKAQKNGWLKDERW
jgi:hypothetical protein